jgi:hypothetical protein
MTESENSVPADQILEKIFEVVLEEARQRPQFAEKLVGALPRGAIAEIQKPESSRKTRAGFDPNAFSLVAVLQTEGTAGLKRRLNPIKRKQDVRSLAEAQHVPVDRERFYSNKTRLPELKHELIRATEARIADRMAAAS